MIDISKCTTREEIRAAQDYEHLKSESLLADAKIYRLNTQLQWLNVEISNEEQHKKDVEAKMEEYKKNYPIEEWEVTD